MEFFLLVFVYIYSFDEQKNNIKNLPLFGDLSDNRSDKTNYFFASPTRKEVFTKNTRKKTTRKETRKRLEELKLAVTLSKVINHFFPGLLPALARVNDPINASYITYSVKEKTRSLLVRAEKSVTDIARSNHKHYTKENFKDI